MCNAQVCIITIYKLTSFWREHVGRGFMAQIATTLPDTPQLAIRTLERMTLLLPGLPWQHRHGLTLVRLTGLIGFHLPLQSCLTYTEILSIVKAFWPETLAKLELSVIAANSS